MKIYTVKPNKLFRKWNDKDEDKIQARNPLLAVIIYMNSNHINGIPVRVCGDVGRELIVHTDFWVYVSVNNEVPTNKEQVRYSYKVEHR
jgi:hypothetical protein